MSGKAIKRRDGQAEARVGKRSGVRGKMGMVRRDIGKTGMRRGMGLTDC